MGKHKELRNPVWEKKKNAIKRNYQKILTKDKSSNASYKQLKNQKFSSPEKKPFFQQAMQEYERKRAEKERIKQIIEAKRKEKDEALRRYNQKKKEKFIKLSKKTKWGQPVMSGRMEILAEKIEKCYASNPIK